MGDPFRDEFMGRSGMKHTGVRTLSAAFYGATRPHYGGRYCGTVDPFLRTAYRPRASGRNQRPDIGPTEAPCFKQSRKKPLQVGHSHDPPDAITNLEASLGEIDRQDVHVCHGLLLRKHHNGAHRIIRCRAKGSAPSVQGVRALPAPLGLAGKHGEPGSRGRSRLCAR